MLCKEVDDGLCETEQDGGIDDEVDQLGWGEVAYTAAGLDSNVYACSCESRGIVLNCRSEVSPCSVRV